MSFDELLKLYTENFSMGFINSRDAGEKLALISLTCHITNELRKKGKKLNCYEVLLLVAKDYPEHMKSTFLKSLGVICEDLMYGCDTYPDFGIKSKEMPKTLRELLDKYVPF